MRMGNVVVGYVRVKSIVNNFMIQKFYDTIIHDTHHVS